jgi:hypothetical protein
MFAVLADGALSHRSRSVTMEKMAILMDKMVFGDYGRAAIFGETTRIFLA